MLKKTMHFFDMDLVEYIPTQGYPKISKAAVCTCTTK